MRGNSTNSASAAGTACASSSAALRAQARAGRCGALNPTRVAVITASAVHIKIAVGMPCV